MFPGYRVTIIVYAYTYLMHKGGTKVSAMYIILTGPNHFDELSAGLGNMNSFRYEITLRCCPSAKGASQEYSMHAYLIGLKAQDLRSCCLFGHRHLRAGPDLAMVFRQLYGSILRFHRRMCQVRESIFRFQHFCSFGKRISCIAFLCGGHSFGTGQLSILLQLGRTVYPFIT